MAQDSKPDTLEDRLKRHAKSFDGLLSIIPAKHYYGEDTSDQWQRKKQTKEEARAAKLAKLDPDNVKSAKDVLDEQAVNQRKRKREEEGDGRSSDVEGIEVEKPAGPAKKRKQTKKQRREDKGDTSVLAKSKSKNKTELDRPELDAEGQRQAKVEKKREKRERKKAKAEKATAKAQARKAKKIQETALREDEKDATVGASEDIEDSDEVGAPDIDAIDIDEAFDQPPVDPQSTASPSPPPQSPPFDTATQHSGSSSISSIMPPIITTDPELPAKEQETTDKELEPQPTQPPPPQTRPTQSKPDPEALKLRLQARIDFLRAQRKADGPDGAPARSRQELLEARRRKEEERKAHKKTLRRAAKEEEARKKAETLARGSPLFSPSSPHSTPDAASIPTNFSFNRITFPLTNEHASSSLNTIHPTKKPKGPSDPHTALLAHQNKEARLSALDPTKRDDIAEKDLWLAARKRAAGEKVRDDGSLLKKTLKRKEKMKKRSEKAWEERVEGVQKAKEARVKKREGNLARRREEKGGKGKGSGKVKAKARPGFEGSFRARGHGGEGGKKK